MGDKLNLLQAGSVVAMNLKWIRHSTNVLDSGATEESMLASVNQLLESSSGVLVLR